MKTIRCSKCQRRRPKKKLYQTQTYRRFYWCLAMTKCSEVWLENSPIFKGAHNWFQYVAQYKEASSVPGP